MNPREALAAIVERLEAIEKALAQYGEAIRAKEESDRNNPQCVRAEITFDDATKHESKIEANRQNSTQGKIARYAFYAFLAAFIYAGISALQLSEMRTQTSQVFNQANIDNANASGQTAQVFHQLEIARQQASAAQDSVKAVQRQMIEDQRAWLTINFGNLQWAEGKPLSIPVTVTNVGKTPARKYVVNVVIQRVENTRLAGQSIKFRYEGVPRFLDFSGYVLPNDPINVVAQSGELAADKKTGQPSILSHDDAVKLSVGEEFVIIYAEATYKDIFGISHWTRLCKFSSPSAKRPMLPSAQTTVM